MTLQTATDRAVARENRLARAGMPTDFPPEALAAMEADVLAHPEKYPILYHYLSKDLEAER